MRCKYTLGMHKNGVCNPEWHTNYKVALLSVMIRQNGPCKPNHLQWSGYSFPHTVDIAFSFAFIALITLTSPKHLMVITIIVVTVHPASLQAFRLLQTWMCEQLSIPKSKSRAQGTLEAGPDSVNYCRFSYVYQRQETCFIIEQDAYAIRFTHQSHGNNLPIGHGKPLALSVAKHPRGAVGAHAVLPRHTCVGHTETELLRFFDGHLPVVSSAADLPVAKHNSPVAETFRVILHLTGVQAQNTVYDASVFLEEVQTAVSCPLIKLKLKTYREEVIIIIMFLSKTNASNPDVGNWKKNGQTNPYLICINGEKNHYSPCLDLCLTDQHAWPMSARLLLFGNNSEVKSTNHSKHKVPSKINMRSTKVNVLCHISSLSNRERPYSHLKIPPRPT